jgi:hypothetical protein
MKQAELEELRQVSLWLGKMAEQICDTPLRIEAKRRADVAYMAYSELSDANDKENEQAEYDAMMMRTDKTKEVTR